MSACSGAGGGSDLPLPVEGDWTVADPASAALALCDGAHEAVPTSLAQVELPAGSLPGTFQVVIGLAVDGGAPIDATLECEMGWATSTDGEANAFTCLGTSLTELGGGQELLGLDHAMTGDFTEVVADGESGINSRFSAFSNVTWTGTPTSGCTSECEPTCAATGLVSARWEGCAPDGSYTCRSAAARGVTSRTGR